MKTWSMSINDGKAELEVPPDGLIATLMPAKAGTFNPLRPAGAAKNEKSNSSAESTFPTVATPVHPMHPYPPYPGLPPYYYNPYTPPLPPIQPSLPAAPGPIPHPTDFSDSFAEGHDPVERLIAYVAWLVSKSPMQAPALVRAKQSLLEEGHTFKTIENLSDADFDKMGIKSGTGMQLRDYIELFKRKMLNYV